MDILDMIKELSKNSATLYKGAAEDSEDFSQDDKDNEPSEWQKEQQADWDHDRMADFKELNRR